jgi:hypothetical protein
MAIQVRLIGVVKIKVLLDGLDDITEKTSKNTGIVNWCYVPGTKKFEKPTKKRKIRTLPYQNDERTPSGESGMDFSPVDKDRPWKIGSEKGVAERSRDSDVLEPKEELGEEREMEMVEEEEQEENLLVGLGLEVGSQSIIVIYQPDNCLRRASSGKGEVRKKKKFEKNKNNTRKLEEKTSKRFKSKSIQPQYWP